MKRLCLLVIVALLGAIGACQRPAPKPSPSPSEHPQLQLDQRVGEGLACGEWLAQTANQQGYVTIQVQPHLGCPGENYPFLGVWPCCDGEEWSKVLPVDPFTFNFGGSAGEYRLTLGSTCGTCARIMVTVEK